MSVQGGFQVFRVLSGTPFVVLFSFEFLGFFFDRVVDVDGTMTVVSEYCRISTFDDVLSDGLKIII